MRRLAAGVVGALLAAGAGLVVTAAPAAAHNVVVDTSPGTGATVAVAPTQVSVTFDDVVLDLTGDGSGTVVQVTDATGGQHAVGCPVARDRTVTSEVSIDEPGEYTVAWRIVSADGHPTSGGFTFTYAPDGVADAEAPADDAPSAGPPGTARADAAGCGAASSGAAAADGAGGADGTGEAGPGDVVVVLGIAGGVVLLAGAGVLVALRVARRRD